MSKIGNYEYPDLRVSDAIDLAKKFHEKLNGTTQSPDALAGAWGHSSAKSGTFLVKLGAMRKYGLIDGRGQSLALSSLAEKILFPKKDEYDVAVKEMIFKIDIWKKLYERLNGKEPDSNFWIILQEITNIDRATANAEADKISKFYKDVLSYLKAGDTKMFNQSPTPNLEPDYSGSMPSADIHKIDFEGILMRIPKEHNSIDTAIELLQMLKKKESTRQTSKSKKE
ncbi:MAG: hypothetical protein HYY37_04770 [Candidatus Aenigmarchaeota archaeon]|nr:hypothetical protein [Candidatus Aenigmarchaeota archaeon]